MAAVRLTYEDVDTAKMRIAKLIQRFPPVQTESLRINTDARPFSEWPEFCAEVETYSVLRVGNHQFKLRQRPDLSRTEGYIQWGYSQIRSFDGRPWPELKCRLDIGGVSPLTEGRLNREVHLLGYSDVFEAANALCELNVSQRDIGCDFSVSFPVFAAITGIRVKTMEKRIEVDVERHRDFSDLRAVVCLRGQTTLVDQPFREQKIIPDFPTEAVGQIISAKGSVQFDHLSTEDWLEVRLVHPRVGEVKRDGNSVRMLIAPAERNILLEALRLFCGDTTLDDLLVRGYNVQTPRLKHGAAFELHVAWLLGMFGLSTVVLGNYEHIVGPDTPVRRASVDILAASQRGKLLIAVACTLNPPNADDFSNLRYAREILAREVFSETGVRVIPVLFTSAMGCPSYDSAEDIFDRVPIVDSDNMKNLLGLLRSGQESRFFEFLANPTLGRLSDSSQP
jgi:hypothetical protein